MAHVDIFVVEDAERVVGDGAPGNGVVSNGAPDDGRVAASNNARAVGDNVLGNGRGASSDDARAVGNSAPGNGRGATGNDAPEDGNGTVIDGAPARECAPGGGRGKATKGAPDNVPALSWLGWDIALSETLGRVLEKFGQVRPGAAAVEGRKRKHQNGLVCSGVGVLDGLTVVRETEGSTLSLS